MGNCSLLNRDINFQGVDTTNIIANFSSGSSNTYTATQDCGAIGQIYSGNYGYLYINNYTIAIFGSGRNEAKSFKVPLKIGDTISGGNGWAGDMCYIFGVKD